MIIQKISNELVLHGQQALDEIALMEKMISAADLTAEERVTLTTRCKSCRIHLQQISEWCQAMHDIKEIFTS